MEIICIHVFVNRKQFKIKLPKGGGYKNEYIKNKRFPR